MTTTYGTPDADVLAGGSDLNVIYGFAGDDTLTGGPDRNLLIGGLGADTLIGGTGSDILIAGDGVGALYPGRGTSIVLPTTAAADVLDGGAGSDTAGYVLAAETHDIVIDISNPSIVAPVLIGGVAMGSITNVENLIATGGSGNDHFTSGGSGFLSGAGGDDVLSAALGTLDGGQGNDILIAGSGTTTLTGGAGVDTVVFAGALAQYVIQPLGDGAGKIIGPAGPTGPTGPTYTLTGVEYLQFSDQTVAFFSDVHVAGSGGETLTGASGGNSLLIGGDGPDIITAVSGVNSLNGGAGDDHITGGIGSDQIDGGAGNDVITDGGGVGVDAIYGGDGDDVITSTAAANVGTILVGDGGNDHISGAGRLSGGEGNDVLTDTWMQPAATPTTVMTVLDGGAGDDILIGNGISTTVAYASAPTGVHVDLGLTVAQDTGAVGMDTLSGIVNLTGSAHNDILTGDAHDNTLNGFYGDDVLSGLGGNDTLIGSFGNDVLDGGAGNDTVSYSDAASLEGTSSVVGVTVSLAISGPQFTGEGGGTDTLISIENLIGSDHNDTLIGDSGDNTLNDGAGDDTLTGADGNDTLVGGAGNDTLDGGSGVNVADYSASPSALTVNLRTGVVSGSDVGTDQLSNIQIVSAGSGDDQFLVGTGITLINGGAGTDVVELSGSESDYTITQRAAGSFKIETAGTIVGVINVEQIKFDGSGDVLTLTPSSSPIDHPASQLISSYAGLTAPSAHNDAFTLQAGQVLTNADVLANDTDISPVTLAPDGLTITDLTLPSDFVGSVTIQSNNTLTIDPGSFVGQESFTYGALNDRNQFTIATVTLTVTGAGPSQGDLPDAYAVTREGTRDGSASTNDLLIGLSDHTTFFFKVTPATGADEIYNFGKNDVLVTDKALFDGNHDGVITFGANGLLNLDGADKGDSVQIDGLNPNSGVRYLGDSEGVFIYADASVRPLKAIESHVSDDALAGDLNDAKAQTFFFDTALGLHLGADTISNFGAKDILVTTTAFAGGAAVVTADSTGAFELASPTGAPAPSDGAGTVSISAIGGGAVTSLEFDGSITHNGVDYYVYSLAGSAAGTGALHFG